MEISRVVPRYLVVLAGFILAASGTVLAVPVLVGISPTSGPTAGGSLITLTGQNFGSSPQVTIGTREATVQTGGTDNSIVVSSPAGEGANLDLKVVAAGSFSNAVAFSYLPPSISSLTPATGPTAGGSLITVIGSNFGLNPSVTIGGSSAPNIFASHSQVVCTLPAGQGLNREVRVTAAGQVSPPAGFNYLPPAITSIAAQSAPTAGNVPITVRGSNFGLSSSVKIGDQTAPVTLSTHETLVAQLPAGEGTGLPLVVTTSGQISNTVAFDYDAPLLSSLSPASGPTAGGTVITINGSSFGTTPTASLSGSPLAVVTASHTRITAVLPVGQGVDLPIIVSTAGGRVSQALNFSYSPPAITSISPASAPTAGNVPITVIGSNFGLSPLVSVGSRSATVQFSTASQIIASLPAGEGTDLPVLVNAGGQPSNSVNFSYDAPLLASVSPASGPTLGGSVITLKGSNFGLAPSVKIGGVTAPITQGGHSQLLVTLPTGEGKDLQVSLMTADQRQANPLLFSYLPPQITSISPANGPTSGGTILTVRGSDFGISKVVTIGGKTAALVAAGSHGEVRVTTPVGTGSSLPLAITTAGQVSNTLLFSYDPATFASWESIIAWGGLSSAPEADPRGNGWKNLLSYALGVNPPTTHGGEIASRNPVIFGKPAMTTDPLGRLQIGFWCRRAGFGDDLVYQVQFGGDLAGTAWEPATSPPAVDPWDAIWEYRVVTDHSSAGGRRFARLRVETTSPPSP